jgi:hypothetical protein
LIDVCGELSVSGFYRKASVSGFYRKASVSGFYRKASVSGFYRKISRHGPSLMRFRANSALRGPTGTRSE